MSDPHPTGPSSPLLDALGSPVAKPEWNKDIKAYYDAIASEPIPDEIQALMASLAKAIRK